MFIAMYAVCCISLVSTCFKLCKSLCFFIQNEDLFQNGHIIPVIYSLSAYPSATQGLHKARALRVIPIVAISCHF